MTDEPMAELAGTMPFADLVGIDLASLTPESVIAHMDWAPERCTAADAPWRSHHELGRRGRRGTSPGPHDNCGRDRCAGQRRSAPGPGGPNPGRAGHVTTGELAGLRLRRAGGVRGAGVALPQHLSVQLAIIQTG